MMKMEPPSKDHLPPAHFPNGGCCAAPRSQVRNSTVFARHNKVKCEANDTLFSSLYHLPELGNFISWMAKVGLLLCFPPFFREGYATPQEGRGGKGRKIQRRFLRQKKASTLQVGRAQKNQDMHFFLQDRFSGRKIRRSFKVGDSTRLWRFIFHIALISKPCFTM